MRLTNKNVHKNGSSSSQTSQKQSKTTTNEEVSFLKKLTRHSEGQ